MEGLPDWEPILEGDRGLWEEARRTARDGPNVLVATTVGGFSALSLIESALAVALTLRGARVHTLLCDKVLPACLRAKRPEVEDPGILARYELPKVLCDPCLSTGSYVYDPLGLDAHRLSNLLTREDRDEARRLASATPAGEVEGYRLNGWAVGEHAHAGALRYFASGNLANESAGDVVVRRYFEGALLTAYAMDRLLRRQRFQAACFHHGIYSPQGVVGELCRASDVRVVNWNIAYRKRCFIFSHGDTYHHTLLAEPTETWDRLSWTERMEAEILDYLKSRWQGTRDWIWFHEKPDEEFDRYAQQIGLDPTRPVIGMLTNVMWDAQLHYRANAFPDMLAWALATIHYFAGRPDLQLLIRVHPAEIRGTMPSRQPILAEIAKVYPKLPPNVFAIPPESPVSTYAAMERCNAVVIYGTKTGVELTSIGIPVIVGGEAWIRNKGLTLDASSPHEYFALLDRLPLARGGPAEVQERVVRARKYAYHFFFRRMIPFSSVEAVAGWPPYRLAISRLEDLLPGRDPGLDVVCEGIMKGSPFVFPAERLGVHDA
jgi:hypothetical protein